jgi:hypothetical protein
MKYLSLDLVKMRNDYMENPYNLPLYLDIANVIIACIDKSPLTETAYKYIMYYDPNTDLNMNPDQEEPTQQAIVRLCLFYTIGYALVSLFVGFIETVKEDRHEFVEWFLELQKVGLKYLRVMKTEYLQILLPKLTDKYAKIFHNEKIGSFHKDIYGVSTVKVPSMLDKINATELKGK